MGKRFGTNVSAIFVDRNVHSKGTNCQSSTMNKFTFFPSLFVNKAILSDLRSPSHIISLLTGLFRILPTLIMLLNIVSIATNNHVV